jgi:hypothetical protein
LVCQGWLGSVRVWCDKFRESKYLVERLLSRERGTEEF